MHKWRFNLIGGAFTIYNGDTLGRAIEKFIRDIKIVADIISIDHLVEGCDDEEDRSRFLNRCRMLQHLPPGALLPVLGDERLRQYYSDPYKYFINCDKRDRDVIWRALRSREMIGT